MLQLPLQLPPLRHQQQQQQQQQQSRYRHRLSNPSLPFFGSKRCASNSGALCMRSKSRLRRARLCRNQHYRHLSLPSPSRSSRGKMSYPLCRRRLATLV
jgi:hypothetical protein